MKRIVLIGGALVAVALFDSTARSQGPYDWTSGRMGPGMMWGCPCMPPGMMGPGMMGGPGWAASQAQLTEENAKAIAQQYTDKYLKGYMVERVLPITGMGGMTMYQVELKGPNGETRILHVNPWGNVMPVGAAQMQGR